MKQILFITFEQKALYLPAKNVLRVEMNYRPINWIFFLLILAAIFFYFDPFQSLRFISDSMMLVTNFNLYLSLFIGAPGLVLLINTIRESLVRYPMIINGRNSTLTVGGKRYPFSEVTDIFATSGRFSSRKRIYSLFVVIAEQEILICSTFGEGKVRNLLDLEKRMKETIFIRRQVDGEGMRKRMDFSLDELRLHLAFPVIGSTLSIVAWLFFPEYQITHLSSDSGIHIWYLGVCLIYTGFLHAMGYPVTSMIVSKSKPKALVAIIVFFIPIGLYFLF